MIATPITATIECPVCGEDIPVSAAPRLTSQRTPEGTGVLVFLEVDQTKLDRHAAGHLTEEQAAA